MRNAKHRLRVNDQPDMDGDIAHFRMYALDERDIVVIGVCNLSFVDGDMLAAMRFQQLRKQPHECLILALSLAQLGSWQMHLEYRLSNGVSHGSLSLRRALTCAR